MEQMRRQRETQRRKTREKKGEAKAGMKAQTKRVEAAPEEGRAEKEEEGGKTDGGGCPLAAAG